MCNLVKALLLRLGLEVEEKHFCSYSWHWVACQRAARGWNGHGRCAKCAVNPVTDRGTYELHSKIAAHVEFLTHIPEPACG